MSDILDIKAKAPFPASALSNLAPHALRDHQLVDVAPLPVLTRLERPHDRMLGGVEVLRRVAVGRGIAAAHVAAGETQPQVHPLGANGETVLAAIGAGVTSRMVCR